MVRQGLSHERQAKRADLIGFGEEEGIGESITERRQASVCGDRMSWRGMVGLVERLKVRLAWPMGGQGQDQMPSSGGEVRCQVQEVRSGWRLTGCYLCQEQTEGEKGLFIK